MPFNKVSSCLTQKRTEMLVLRFDNTKRKHGIAKSHLMTKTSDCASAKPDEVSEASEGFWMQCA